MPVDLAAATRAIVEEMAKTSRERRLQIDLRAPEGSLVVVGDPVRLEQILNNLLTNALKYTPAHGRIDVSLAAERGEAVLRVADTGVGISAEVLPTIFEPFTQAARTLDRAQGGIGLGLSVVRALARLHGGDVAVTSPGLGRGSEFVVRLPLAATQRIEDPTMTPEPELASIAPRHILIVEDGADNRESLQELLEAQGHRVDTAIDGERGIERALAGRPDVALVDIGLPLLDGYEVARRIRGAMGSEIFLIALTGYGQPDDRARAAAAGFDVHITKPLDFRTLERLLGGVAGRGATGAARRSTG
jgi:CheY-like chemotaxis protein